MMPFKMNTLDIVEEIKESFNYYSIDEINLIYEFIKTNETTVDRVVYDRNSNKLSVES